MAAPHHIDAWHGWPLHVEADRRSATIRAPGPGHRHHLDRHRHSQDRRARRARLFCDAYALQDRGELVDKILERQRAGRRAIKQATDPGDPAYQRLLVVGLPVTWAATDLAAAARRWFRRLRRSDGLSRIVRAAAGDLDLSDAEFAAVRRLLEEESTWVEIGRGTVEELAAQIASRLPRGADDRIRQADTLPPAWRIVLTSRPGSWNRQLAVGGGGPSRRVGELQPLRYPEDVEPFIAGWFSGRPARATAVTAQLRVRPTLRQAATVPLVLAFYCIIGGDQPLPARRADLYAKVIRRMLTSRWRGSGAHDPDPDACVEILRDWAWSAAASNQVSGVGAWADEFPTPRVRQSQDDRDALDHVAAPLGPPDPDTGMTRRRFVHRSLREHLAAEHIAVRMSAEEAVGELLNHLWYDPDWEYAAPAALAMHPRRGQVLKELIGRVTRGGQLRADLAAIDGCWEVRRFLARVALESGESDWPPETSEMIGQARLDLATSRRDDLRQLVAGDWPASNGLIIKSLLARLAGEDDPWPALELAEAVAGLAVTAEERARAREALLGLFAGEDDPGMAGRLAEAVAGLDPAGEERARILEALLGLLASELHPVTAWELAEAVARLSPTVADLGGSDSWPVLPTPALLAAARQNSGLAAWLAALPLLSS